jgi:hypothetical protein
MGRLQKWPDFLKFWFLNGILEWINWWILENGFLSRFLIDGWWIAPKIILLEMSQLENEIARKSSFSKNTSVDTFQRGDQLEN